MDDAAEHVAPADRSGSGFVLGRCGLRRVEFEGTVWPSSVVVVEVLAQDRLEVTPAEYQEVVEAVVSDGADEAFGERVGVWGGRGS